MMDITPQELSDLVIENGIVASSRPRGESFVNRATAAEIVLGLLSLEDNLFIVDQPDRTKAQYVSRALQTVGWTEKAGAGTYRDAKSGTGWNRGQRKWLSPPNGQSGEPVAVETDPETDTE